MADARRRAASLRPDEPKSVMHVNRLSYKPAWSAPAPDNTRQAADLHDPVTDTVWRAILTQGVVVAGQAVSLPQIDLPPCLGLPMHSAGSSKVQAQKVAAHNCFGVRVATDRAAGRHLQKRPTQSKAVYFGGGGGEQHSVGMLM